MCLSHFTFRPAQRTQANVGLLGTLKGGLRAVPMASDQAEKVVIPRCKANPLFPADPQSVHVVMSAPSTVVKTAIETEMKR
jgi:hypothetical protein